MLTYAYVMGDEVPQEIWRRRLEWSSFDNDESQISWASLTPTFGASVKRELQGRKVRKRSRNLKMGTLSSRLYLILWIVVFEEKALEV